MANKDDIYPLFLVPGLYKLLENFSSRQLALFCRVLSLIVFEPEDRHLFEGNQQMRAFELLRLRRNRIQRSSNNTVERNQNLVSP